MTARTAIAALAVTVIVALASAGRVAAQPAGSAAAGSAAAGSAAAGSGGSGALPIRIQVQPGQPVQIPVRPGQPGGPGGPPQVIRPNQPPPMANLDDDAGSAAPYAPPDHGDIRTGTGKDKPLLALAFWLFAAITIGGALFVISRRNLIAAVMGMVGTFFGIAAAYMMLYGAFLAVVQMLVYAGAIMVLFVFVIMILNRPEDEPFGGAGAGRFGKGLAGLGLAYLAFRLVSLVWSVAPLKTSGPAPAPVQDLIGSSRVPVDYAFGGTKAVGHELFNDYLFPFEAISILLLVAVVGAIAIARPMPADEGEPPAEGQP